MALDISYRPAFLDTGESLKLYSWLQRRVVWQQEPLVLYGRRMMTPRLVAWHGDVGLDYRYSRRSHLAAGWPGPLADLRHRLSEEVGEEFNFVLLNRYRNGNDCMGWHRDDEAGIGGPIASISLGAERRFLIRGDSDALSTRIDLEEGSLLMFDGALKHCLPRTRKALPERINLTFRRLL